MKDENEDWVTIKGYENDRAPLSVVRARDKAERARNAAFTALIAAERRLGDAEFALREYAGRELWEVARDRRDAR
jgi:hypothetical protein